MRRAPLFDGPPINGAAIDDDPARSESDYARYTRHFRVLAAAVSFAACGGEGARPSPTGPGVPSMPGASTQPSSAVGASIWVMVLEPSGVCVVGASVSVVDGEGVGPPMTHSRPCNAWGYDQEILFSGFKPGAAVTLRASAPGYVTRQVTAYAGNGGPATEIVLERARYNPGKHSATTGKR